MSVDRPHLQALLSRIREGDEDAARELLVHFEAHVRRVVRQRLPVVMRSKFDSMDFVQSVWGEFFPRLARGDIDFDSPYRLAKFLAVVAQGKVTNEFRRRFGKKLAIQKEFSVGSGLFYLPGRGGDPTPSETVAAGERIEFILNGRPEVHRKVLELRREGFTFVEISAKLGIDERTARRIMHAIEEELRHSDATPQE
jgi:RNA polymerase sigma-70 factor (ECF subfamily)